MDLAKKQSSDNPVYYVQYAHARIASLLKQWGGDTATLINADFQVLNNDEKAQELAVAIAQFPETIESAARDLSVHKIAFYLRDIAALFHAWYNAARIIVPEESETRAKLALCRAVQIVLQNALGILGVAAPERMEKNPDEKLA